MTLPAVVFKDEWLEARTALLAEEKALWRARDALNAKRRELPMVEVTEPYVFTGPDGELSLRDLFGDHLQLIVGHFMFDPSWEDGCPSCTAGAQEIAPGLLEHLAVRDTAFTYVSRAPYEKLARYKDKMGWTMPWVSSSGSTFNVDLGVTLDAEHTAYNFADLGDDPAIHGEYPGQSYFLRVEDRVFHTTSIFARGVEMVGGSYGWLDNTALGRQEDWEQPRGRAGSARAGRPDFAS